ncbi:hypothetical protein LWI28_006248 [Acer negundo]|uniref:GAG-pre-integrase domain-containing protein n=1 Tax=Acer negundo TaxID=4023 RepID=A0AAD5ID93_ACENE|nr:hypothetical protein LWI28_006248 [Acer negundo]
MIHIKLLLSVGLRNTSIKVQDEFLRLYEWRPGQFWSPEVQLPEQHRQHWPDGAPSHATHALWTHGYLFSHHCIDTSCKASTLDDGEVLYIEGNSATKGRKRFANVCLLDSATTWHMTSQREWFHKYEPVFGGSVFMGNDQALEIAVIGTIKIKMHDGTIHTIQEVRHVKSLKKNLLSLGQLDDLRCKTQIENGILKIVRGALVVIKAEKITSNLYMLKGETLQEADSCVASTNHGEESTIMWHHKLNHISERGLKILSDQNLLHGLKSVNLPFCEHCVTKDQLQKEEDDIISKENTKTTDVHMENNLELEDSVSFKAEPRYETQVPDEFEAPEVRWSTRKRRPLVWHSEYVTESNVAYCLLIEDGEPLTFHEARNSSDASL